MVDVLTHGALRLSELLSHLGETSGSHLQRLIPHGSHLWRFAYRKLGLWVQIVKVMKDEPLAQVVQV